MADAALTAEEPEPDSGSISGTITDDSDPVSGVTVEAYVGGAVIGSATSAADGTYTISELVDDTYTVLASTGPAENPDSYFSAWYTDAPLFLSDDATDVVVAEGADTGGVDIALQPLFVDVAAGSGFYADIVWMQESGITLGCGNDAYCASDSVTRAQMATFLVRALEESGARRHRPLHRRQRQHPRGEHQCAGRSRCDDGVQRRRNVVLPERHGDQSPDGFVPGAGRWRSWRPTPPTTSPTTTATPTRRTSMRWPEPV